MAFVDQAKKAVIAAELKRIMPKGWKYSLAVSHHSTLVLTIASAPVDLIAECRNKCHGQQYKYLTIPKHYLDESFSGSVLVTLHAIVDAMNTGNHDRSDSMTDYFDVGHYIEVRAGRWDKPFVVAK